MTKRRFAQVALTLLLLLATAVPALALPSEQPVLNAIHVVQAGETLSSIAQRYGTTVQAIMAANGLANANLVYVGQRLRIPGASAGTSAGTTTGVYVVQPGDSLGAIAARYNTTVANLMALNGITNASRIIVGQRLRVNGSAPAAGGSATTAGARVHVVARGDSLSAIAARYGITVSAVMAANGIRSANLIIVGQRLRIPSAGATSSSGGATTYPGGSRNLRFQVSISAQRCQLYAGNTLLNTWRCSTGRQGSGTKAGTFRVQSKIRNAWGSRWQFWMPYWLGIYWAGSSENGIHGQPWYPNGGQVWAGLVGTPITFGCVMLDNTTAAQLYSLAYIGMPVVIRY
ncbi:MAG: LysM peptidoglycan-binding domain-containing protein [Anaerolineae bacterium]